MPVQQNSSDNQQHPHRTNEDLAAHLSPESGADAHVTVGLATEAGDVQRVAVVMPAHAFPHHYTSGVPAGRRGIAALCPPASRPGRLPQFLDACIPTR